MLTDTLDHIRVGSLLVIYETAMIRDFKRVRRCLALHDLVYSLGNPPTLCCSSTSTVFIGTIWTHGCGREQGMNIDKVLENLFLVEQHAR